MASGDQFQSKTVVTSEMIIIASLASEMIISVS